MSRAACCVQNVELAGSLSGLEAHDLKVHLHCAGADRKKLLGARVNTLTLMIC